ncbi:MAG TPA: hypothetical protein VI603_12730 [Saprospiraceae bacterium]|nr:hypothetical protein [Saprospiraceae bacterium]
MKQIFYFVKPLILVTILTTVIASCKDDDVKPTTATIKGVVTIDSAYIWATWQDSGEVQLTIFPAFSLNPPAGWGEVPDNILGPGVPGGTFPIGAPWNSQNPLIATYQAGVTQYSYELIVDPGTYSALALGFRHNFVSDPTRKTATLGVYWNNENEVSHGIVIRPFVGGDPIFDFPAPSSIIVEAGDEIELNFRANFAFVEHWY